MIKLAAASGNIDDHHDGGETNGNEKLILTIKN